MNSFLMLLALAAAPVAFCADEAAKDDAQATVDVQDESEEKKEEKKAS